MKNFFILFYENIMSRVSGDHFRVSTVWLIFIIIFFFAFPRPYGNRSSFVVGKIFYLRLVTVFSAQKISKFGNDDKNMDKPG